MRVSHQPRTTQGYIYDVEAEDIQDEERDRRDIEIIERHAARLNREAIDVMKYQQLWPENEGEPSGARICKTTPKRSRR